MILNIDWHSNVVVHNEQVTEVWEAIQKSFLYEMVHEVTRGLVLLDLVFSHLKDSVHKLVV